MRILFVTDLHGSTLVFEKAVLAANRFGVDLFIVGGDLSGKWLLPIVPVGSKKYTIYETFKKRDETGKAITETRPQGVLNDTLPGYQRRLEGLGYYWHIVKEEEIEGLNGNDHVLLQLFETKIYQRLVNWIQFLNQHLDEGIECIWTGGNDDSPGLLTRLTHEDLGRFVYAEDKIYEIDGYEVISLGWSNETGFDTDRELDEPDILQRLRSLAKRVSRREFLILNVHVPPRDCGVLDSCIKGNDADNLVHVGSTAVRNFIEDYQPLVDFAGHIHEGKGAARIGRTLVFNPGSNYHVGVLNGFLVELAGQDVKNYRAITM